MTRKTALSRRPPLARVLLLGAATLTFSSQGAHAQAMPEPLYVKAGHVMLDPAVGTFETDKTLVVQDGKVTGIVDGFAVPAGAHVIDLRDRWVLPGLIDSHVHLTSDVEEGSGRTLSAAAQAMNGIGKAQIMLNQGFTTVADLNGEAEAVFALRDAVDEGLVMGPHILAAGAAIAAHGGHGDVNGQRREVVLALRSPSVCSGADDCRRATREMIMMGADLVKVAVTGGVLSNTNAGLGQQLTDAEIAAVVDAAHHMGRRVTAHAHGADGIEAFLRAGGDSIEHGTFIDAEGVRMLQKTDRYFIPTLLVGEIITRKAKAPGPGGMSPAQREKALAVGPKMIDAARRVHAAGARIAFGTDVVSNGPETANAREFVLLTQAGLSPLEAIRTATVNGADHLGLSAQAGALTPGHDADLIAVSANPLQDVSILQKVSFVMKTGHVVRD
ncbi:imidazolonepropionase-like amidohydrolase [Novosphingobium chloroacetimidivorans]|uniref:Imidazolonepropionase-like amidohydrolase n=1 Tax=Novosphingobium chloroacetimidivorans TaxID=1428314 RepID=A0A7W7K816_9SPHN|nr:amidohydrolase family protein [Novosphingobium chloroacetimidivorans]MBB4857954.1 imidazolonepropionase-like amidohydrolase [Novosphingobium chloroacetimidivorans]